MTSSPLATSRVARLPFSSELAGPDGEDAAALRLLLGRIGQQNAARGLFFRFEGFNDDAIVQGLYVDVFILCHGIRFLSE